MGGWSNSDNKAISVQFDCQLELSLAKRMFNPKKKIDLKKKVINFLVPRMLVSKHKRVESNFKHQLYLPGWGEVHCIRELKKFIFV